jgi:hypothetical protein
MNEEVFPPITQPRRIIMSSLKPFEREAIAKEYPKLRQNFKSLLALNPNHFGNSGKSSLVSSISIKSNTVYERLGCIGFQPELNMLKAVIYIHQTTGYGSGLCGIGSTEYVRFFLSSDDGATWQDQGLTSLQVYNVDHASRLEYAVEKAIDPAQRICRSENLLRVRAILSWEVPPPADPNWLPVWGNRSEATIQVAPKRLVKISDVVKLDANVLALLDGAQTLKLKSLDLPLEATAKAYLEAKVPVKRTLHPHLQAALANPSALTALASNPQLAAIAKIYAVDLEKISDQLLFSGDGNQEYEQLTCIGLQTGGFIDTLVGIINVKKSAGFNGGLCTKGSREYIAYYMDFGSGWQYMGTASVRVHDIASIPADGLRYTAYLPTDLRNYRKKCEQAVVVKLRAILSWETPPPVDPNWVPAWGGREDTTVLLSPLSNKEDTDKLTPFITAAGRVSTDKINPLTGLATALSPFVVNQAPFGGEVMISGYILNHPNYSSGGAKLRYKVMISSDGINFAPAIESFDISVDRWVGAVVTQFDLRQEVDSEGFYAYQMDAIGPDFTFVDENVLFRFFTASRQGAHWIRIDVEDPTTLAIIPSNSVKLMIDNTAPNLTFTMVQEPCSDIKVGEPITGTFTANDPHMGDVQISVVPFGVASKTYSLSTDTQKAGTWQVSTAELDKCGYVVQASAVDRTIVNNTNFGNSSAVQSIGFCLR